MSQVDTNGTLQTAISVVPLVVSAFSFILSFVNFFYTTITVRRNREMDIRSREFEASVRAPIQVLLPELSEILIQVKALGSGNNVPDFSSNLEQIQKEKYLPLYDRIDAAVRAGQTNIQFRSQLSLLDKISDHNDEILNRFNSGFNTKNIAQVGKVIGDIVFAIDGLREIVSNDLQRASYNVSRGKN